MIQCIHEVVEGVVIFAVGMTKVIKHANRPVGNNKDQQIGPQSQMSHSHNRDYSHITHINQIKFLTNYFVLLIKNFIQK